VAAPPYCFLMPKENLHGGQCRKGPLKLAGLNLPDERVDPIDGFRQGSFCLVCSHNFSLSGGDVPYCCSGIFKLCGKATIGGNWYSWIQLVDLN